MGLWESKNSMYPSMVVSPGICLGSLSLTLSFTHTLFLSHTLSLSSLSSSLSSLYFLPLSGSFSQTFNSFTCQTYSDLCQVPSQRKHAKNVQLWQKSELEIAQLQNKIKVSVGELTSRTQSTVREIVLITGDGCKMLYLVVKRMPNAALRVTEEEIKAKSVSHGD